MNSVQLTLNYVLSKNLGRTRDFWRASNDWGSDDDVYVIAGGVIGGGEGVEGDIAIGEEVRGVAEDVIAREEVGGVAEDVIAGEEVGGVAGDVIAREEVRGVAGDVIAREEVEGVAENVIAREEVGGVAGDFTAREEVRGVAGDLAAGIACNKIDGKTFCCLFFCLPLGAGVADDTDK